MSRFYETIPQTAQEAISANSKALSQEQEILAFMTENPHNYTAWDLQRHLAIVNGHDYEITSIRRGLWNLENKSKVIEQVGFVPGPKGHKIGQYRAIKTTLF